MTSIPQRDDAEPATSDGPVVAPGSLIAGQRKKRLTYAVLVGGFSKILAIAVQWLALPVALKSLGTDRYAAFLALQALVAWASLLALGLAPSLPRFISRASAEGDSNLQRQIFQTAIIYLTCASAAFVLVMGAVGYIVPPSLMVATHGIATSQIFMAYVTVVLITGFQLVGNVMPSIRGGYQELHYSYAWAGLASLAVMVGLYWFSHSRATITSFLLTIYAPLALFMLADMALICLQRPYLLRGRSDIVKTGRLLAPQAGNALAAQLSYFLVSFLPTLIVAHLSGAEATAAFGSIMQLLILFGSGMNLIFQPLVPAVANAYAHHDANWVRQAYFKVATLVIAVCGIGLVLDFTAGQYLLHRWLGSKLNIPAHLPIVLGLYFSVWMINLMHFNILAATGNLHGTGKIYLLEGALSITLGSLLTYFYGPTGMAVGLVVGTLCLNLWFLTWRTWCLVVRSKSA